MIRKILKWIGGSLLAIIVLLLAGYLFISWNIGQRTEKKYDFAVQSLAIPTDSTSLSRGEHLVVIKGCIECHGKDLGGKLMMDDAGLGRLVASNLTKGQGGLPSDYSTADWIKALRHGVNREGKPLLFMPSHETTLLSEEDLTAVIAYCQQASPVNSSLPTNELGPIVKVMTYLDKMPLLAVEKIDHNLPMIAKADTTVGVAQGKYLSVSCVGCHRAALKGGEPLAPGLPPVPDITSTGNVGKWTQDQFMTVLRTGKTPGGHQISNDDMPWKMTAQYKDKELISLYQYLQSVK
ncbi:c-type cytochrome [Tellurirhabdus bombi]|uniref:c-type cytochrome n=1 Tax=Tellurirhabdus bombi TaxID=2907205 RepID=UPI001F257E0B|nr:c-type cytochrome [Tellurirhabdus bombi]